MNRIGAEVAGRYRLVRRLGAGAMGEVFEATHLPSGRSLAVKILLPGLPREVGLRFEREAKAASLLDHPNIVEVLDFGQLPDGSLFLAMELVGGRELAELLDAGALPPARALAIAWQILDGLACAHERGVIHRDLKPENVMLLEDDTVKLVDFGIAKLVGDAATDVGGGRLSATGVVFGTPAYMSPEQALGRTVDARADVYAAGVILFEMLAGRQPFHHHDDLAILRMHAGAAPPSLAQVAGRPFDPALESLVACALAKRPEERFMTAAAMRNAVGHCRAAC